MENPHRAEAIRWSAWLGLTAATFTASALHRSLCLGRAWDGSQYRAYCYTDLLPLYGLRGLEAGQRPYLDAFNEYPVLTGFFQYLAAVVSSDVTGFFVASAVGLGLAALGVTAWLLWDGAGWPRLAAWAVAPPLLLYAVHNWDLLAVVASAAALVLWRRGAYLGAGIALGLGGAAKLYPLLLVPVLAAALWGQERRRAGVRNNGTGNGNNGPEIRRSESGTQNGGPAFQHRAAPPSTRLGAWLPGPDTLRLGLGAAGAWLAVSLPVFAVAPGGFMATYRFHLDRDPNFESPWRILVEAGFSDAVVGVLAPTILVGGVVALAWLAWRGRLEGITAALGALLLVLLGSTFFSVQYSLWLLPFFVLLKLPWPRIAAFWAADLAVFLTVFRFFLHIGTPAEGAAATALSVAVLARTGALLWLLAWVLAQLKGSQPSSAQYQRTPSPGSKANTPAPTAGDNTSAPRRTE